MDGSGEEQILMDAGMTLNLHVLLKYMFILVFIYFVFKYFNRL